MNIALQTMLRGVFDYAGMFPPAKLPLDEAVRAYVHWRQSPEAWMLGRFVCPLASLTECATLQERAELSGAAPWGVAITARWDELRAGFPELLGRISAAALPHRPSERSMRPRHALEVALSDSLWRDFLARGAHREWWSPILVQMANPGIRIDDLYFEVPWSAIGSPAARQLSEAVRGHPMRSHEGTERLGLKFRTGGLTAEAFPTPEQLAAAILLARDLGLPWKATAGLHHPLRCRDEQLGVWMHGFVNLLTAAAFVGCHNLSSADVVQILEETSPGAFCFTNEGVQFGPWRASCEQIAAMRQNGLISLGTCSIDEPLADLKALAWL